MKIKLSKGSNSLVKLHLYKNNKVCKTKSLYADVLPFSIQNIHSRLEKETT